MHQIITQIKDLVKLSMTYSDLGCWISKIESAIKNFEELTELIRMISQEIKRYDEHYYTLNESLIGDTEYDLLDKILGLLIKLQHTGSADVKKTVGHGGTPDKQIKHLEPMLSLKNGFNLQEVESFFNNISRSFPETVCEYKIDGVAFSALYSDGELKTVATRGDGITGEDVTETGKLILPNTIKNNNKAIEIRGEIFITKQDFRSLVGTYSNARNAASGIFRADNQATRKLGESVLSYYAYSIVGIDFETQFERLEYIKKLGFKTQETNKLVRTKEELESFYNTCEQNREMLPYVCDGVVYKINNIQTQERLGYTAHHPKYMLAHKFPPLEAITTIEGITYQVGRTGAITPVASLNPVKVGDVIIKKVTLNNCGYMENLKLYAGCKVKISRAGDVIPKIIGKIEHGDQNKIYYKTPDYCPSCGSTLVTINKQAYCQNKQGCIDITMHKYLHFISKNGFNIKGLNKNKLRSFINDGQIKDFADFLNVFSNTNINEKIEKAKTIKLCNFIYALGIDGIGYTNAQILTNKYNSIEAIIEVATNKQSELLNLKGFSDKKIHALTNAFTDQSFINELNKLLKIVKLIL